MQFMLNIVVYPILIVFVSYFLCFTCGMKTNGLVLSIGFCKLLVAAYLYRYIYYIHDWKGSKGLDESIFSGMVSIEGVDVDIELKE